MVTVTTFSSGLDEPTGLIFDTAGNLYCANVNNNTISKITPNGTSATTFALELNKPNSLAFDAAGNLYCANIDGNNIIKIASDGTSKSTFASGLNNPTCLAFDSAGYLYCGNYNTDNIIKITPDGTSRTTFASGISGPYGITFDTAGNLYSANLDNNTISKITPGGAKTTFASGLDGPKCLAFFNGNIYCGNYNTNTIIKITLDGTSVTTFASELSQPTGLAFDTAGNLYCANYNANTISKITDTPLVVSNICFVANTPILTDQGIIDIDKINYRVNTIRNKPIKLITTTVTDDKYLVCFEKHSLGQNIPSEKTIMSKNHVLLYKDKMVRAKELVNINESIYRIKYKGEMLYNVLMKTHEKILVNNLVCETLDPESDIAKLLLHIETLSYDEKVNCIESVNNYIKSIKRINTK